MAYAISGRHAAIPFASSPSTMNPMKYSSLYILIAGSALLSSCGLFGHYERDTQGVETLAKDLYRDPQAANAPMTAVDTTSFGNTPWQEVFTEPQLQALISRALGQNTDIRKAQLTVKQAEIGLRVNKLAYLPQIALSPSGTVSKAFIDGASNSKTYEVPLQASWQIDAFGTLYNSKKQGEQTVLIAKASQQATRTAIIAAVANMYYGLQMLDEQQRITKANLELWQKDIEAMEALKDYAGMMNSSAIASAKAQVLQIEASLPTIEDNIRQLENSLCSILHEAPHAIARPAFSATGFPDSFSAGIPMQMLANRPDVAIAEAQLAQQFYGIQAARGAFCPSLNIAASGAFTNSLGTAIMNPGKWLAAGVASLTQPLFAQGKLRANLQVAKINAEAAQLNFEQKLIDAGVEVSNALAAYSTAVTTTDLAEQTLLQLQKAYDDTEYLFHNGNTTTYLEILSAQMNLLNGQLNVANQRYNKVLAVITLYQALGGGRE